MKNRLGAKMAICHRLIFVFAVALSSATKIVFLKVVEDTAEYGWIVAAIGITRKHALKIGRWKNNFKTFQKNISKQNRVLEI